MSVTKTLVGTLAALLAAEGSLDPQRKVADYVPELAESAFGSATVRELMDMTTGIRFSEDYANPEAEVWAHAAAGNPLPKPSDYRGPRSYYEFLATVQPDASTAMRSITVRRIPMRSAGSWRGSVAGTWLNCCPSASGVDLCAEQDAYMSVDSIGTPFAGGGLNTSLRDLARFGEMVRNGGRYYGQQILPAEVVTDIRRRRES